MMILKSLDFVFILSTPLFMLNILLAHFVFTQTAEPVSLAAKCGAILFTALFIGGMQLVLAGNTLPGFILLGSALIPLLVILFK
jgi:hypothetical protein